MPAITFAVFSIGTMLVENGMDDFATMTFRNLLTLPIVRLTRFLLFFAAYKPSKKREKIKIREFSSRTMGRVAIHSIWKPNAVENGIAIHSIWTY